MGTVKIELDLPNFEKEIELKVIINKDGVQSSTPLIDRRIEPINCQVPSDASGQAWKQGYTTSINTNPNAHTVTYGTTNGVSSSGTLAPPVTSTTQAEVDQVHTINKPKIPSSMMGTF